MIVLRLISFWIPFELEDDHDQILAKKVMVKKWSLDPQGFVDCCGNPLTRFLQFDFENTVISTGYGDAVAVWHHAPGGC